LEKKLLCKLNLQFKRKANNTRKQGLPANRTTLKVILLYFYVEGQPVTILKLMNKKSYLKTKKEQ
jgi:hypothetical protein